MSERSKNIIIIEKTSLKFPPPPPDVNANELRDSGSNQISEIIVISDDENEVITAKDRTETETNTDIIIDGINNEVPPLISNPSNSESEGQKAPKKFKSDENEDKNSKNGEIETEIINSDENKEEDIEAAVSSDDDEFIMVETEDDFSSEDSKNSASIKWETTLKVSQSEEEREATEEESEQEESSSEEECSKCKKKTADLELAEKNNGFLRCFSCPKNYHMKCLGDFAKRINGEKEWKCPVCDLRAMKESKLRTFQPSYLASKFASGSEVALVDGMEILAFKAPKKEVISKAKRERSSFLEKMRHKEEELKELGYGNF